MFRPFSFLAFTGLAALLTALAPVANAQQLVQDGGFENANPADAGLGIPAYYYIYFSPATLGDGWNVTQGRIFNNTAAGAAAGLGVPRSGTWAAYLDGGGFLASNTLSQTLTTQVGQSYHVSFYLLDNAANPVTVTFGSQTLYSGPGPATLGTSASDYVPYSFNAVATTASTNLTFAGTYLTGQGTELDDVSVTAATPEPGTLALFATSGLGAFGLMARRRRRK